MIVGVVREKSQKRGRGAENRNGRPQKEPKTRTGGGKS